jgi:hypothetical protein
MPDMTTEDARALLIDLDRYLAEGHEWRWEGDGGLHAPLQDGYIRITFAVDPAAFWKVRNRRPRDP